MTAHKELIPIDKLFLNPKNARFPEVKNEKEELAMIMEQIGSKIRKLAKHISVNGLDPSHSFRVIRDKNNFITLDGNRRLSALKLINNPNIIKLDEKDKSFFDALRKGNNQYLPKEIECVVYDSEDEANGWIELEHTGENDGAGRVEWGSLEKLRFQSNSPGYSSPLELQILDFMKNNINNYNERFNKVKLTNIKRVFSNPEAREMVGIDFVKEKLIIKNKDVLTKNLTKIVEQMNQDDFAVKEIYNVKDIQAWVKKVVDVDDTVIKEALPKNPPIKPDKPSSERNKLIPQEFNIKIDNSKANDIYFELRSINVRTHRNAVGVLFRVFLELSIDCFIEKNKALKQEIEDRCKQKKKSSMYLHYKIKKVVDYMKENNNPSKSMLKAVEIFHSSQKKEYSVSIFHAYVHNIHVTPTLDELNNNWSRLEEFIKKLWEKHEKDYGAIDR